MRMKSKRPPVVTFVAIMDILGAIILLAIGIGALALTTLIEYIPEQLRFIFTWLGYLGGGILVGFGLFGFVVAWGLLSRKSWAWWLTLFGYGLGFAAGLASGVIGFIISLILMLLWLKRDAQKFFGVNLGWTWG